MSTFDQERWELENADEFEMVADMPDFAPDVVDKENNLTWTPTPRPSNKDGTAPRDDQTIPLRQDNQTTLPPPRRDDNQPPTRTTAVVGGAPRGLPGSPVPAARGTDRSTAPFQALNALGLPSPIAATTAMDTDTDRHGEVEESTLEWSQISAVPFTTTSAQLPRKSLLLLDDDDGMDSMEHPEPTSELPSFMLYFEQDNVRTVVESTPRTSLKTMATTDSREDPTVLSTNNTNTTTTSTWRFQQQKRRHMLLDDGDPGRDGPRHSDDEEADEENAFLMPMRKKLAADKRATERLADKDRDAAGAATGIGKPPVNTVVAVDDDESKGVDYRKPPTTGVYRTAKTFHGQNLYFPFHRFKLLDEKLKVGRESPVSVRWWSWIHARRKRNLSRRSTVHVCSRLPYSN